MFSSTVNDNLNVVLDKLGFFSSGNKYSYEGATTITDAVFGIRYLVADELLEGVRNFNIIDGSGEVFCMRITRPFLWDLWWTRN